MIAIKSMFKTTRPVLQRTMATFTEVPQRARVVVVGSGRMGHIRSALLYANPRFDLAGIVDVNFDGALDLAQSYQVC